MNSNYFSGMKLGILGGGQLGKMLIKAASQWDIETHILDPTPGCPASGICSRFVKGSFRDPDTVYAFGKEVDLLTIELEDVNSEALIRLTDEGHDIHPGPHTLKTIQDKGLQKEFYKKNNIPSSPFLLFENKEELVDAVKAGKVKVPFVQKLRTSGYDGRGVAVINDESSLGELLDGASLAEELVDVQKEISVITARNANGDIKAFPPVEMIFNPEANLVEYQLCPAEIEETLKDQAIQLAEEVTNAYRITGLLAVELFLDQENNLYVNEVAPRPHNSGHHTIETAYTSQYEQHLRAICGLPLGSTELLTPSVMVNLLGAPGYSGPVKYRGFEECVAIDGVKVHLYGKEETRPFRKMGHSTIFDANINKAKEKATYVLNTLKIES